MSVFKRYLFTNDTDDDGADTMKMDHLTHSEAQNGSTKIVLEAGGAKV
jgi:hypothetical protein